jgi:hypothetical protein
VILATVLLIFVSEFFGLENIKKAVPPKNNGDQYKF